MNEMTSRIFEADPQGLAILMQTGSPGERVWLPEELAAVLRHQMTAPLEADLPALGRRAAQQFHAALGARQTLFKTFGDLLRHPFPPVELLDLAKQFAKMNRASATSPLPPDVATILYFACIAAALIRCRRRISTLPDAQLLDGLRWCAERPWVDATTRALLLNGMAAVPRREGAAA